MIHTRYAELFQDQPAGIFRSPGRINLIGEHTDYNEGFVLPAAIDKYAYVAAGQAPGTRIGLYAVQFNERVEIDLADIAPVPGSWTNYVLGVVNEIIQAGRQISGFNMVVDGNIPVGAGLSSSAAIESAVCYALNDLFQLGMTRYEMARAGQMAEHTFAGVQVGIMDEFASVFGKKDHAIKLDCRSLEYEEVPLRLDNYKILLLNTNVEHALASTEYNTRRQECAEGVRQVQKHVDGVKSLRDVTTAMLEDHVQDPLIRQRCRYVVEENDRLHAAIAEMRSGNIEGLGRQMFRTHQGLSEEYEVSCPELDYLVDAVRGNPDVAGARMMGGGFGGCTINLVKEDAVENLSAELADRYFRDMGKKLSVYEARTADGSMRISM